MFEVGGQWYDKEASQELRERMIDWRDNCLGSGSFDPEGAVLLSHLIGWMYNAIEILYEKTEEKR